MKETRSPIRSPRILSEILNEVRPPPLLSASEEAELELRGDPEDKLTSFSKNIEKIEDVITKSSDSEESKNRNSRRDSPPPLELAPKNTLPFIVIQSSDYTENTSEEMWESRTAQVSLKLID